MFLSQRLKRPPSTLRKPYSLSLLKWLSVCTEFTCAHLLWNGQEANTKSCETFLEEHILCEYSQFSPLRLLFFFFRFFFISATFLDSHNERTAKGLSGLFHSKVPVVSNVRKVLRTKKVTNHLIIGSFCTFYFYSSNVGCVEILRRKNNQDDLKMLFSSLEELFCNIFQFKIVLCSNLYPLSEKDDEIRKTPNLIPDHYIRCIRPDKNEKYEII